MRKRLVGVLLAGLVAAGCGSSGGSPEAGAPAPQPVDDAPKSDRKAPAKVTDIPNKCGVLTEQQQQEMGMHTPPQARDSNGTAGCQYQQGELGQPGWSAFVGVSGHSSFDKQVKKQASANPEKSEVAGYPVAKVRLSTGCVLYADTADKGFLIANLVQNSATDAPVDLCQQAEKVTEAALQNVPNA